MVGQVFKTIFSKGLPRCFRLLNLAIFLPVLLWPLVFLGTAFLFDTPKNLLQNFFLFLIINAYPVYLVVLAYHNTKLFYKSKTFALLFPSVVLLTLLSALTYFVIETSRNVLQAVKTENERVEQGYLGVNHVYKIIKENVYRHDTLIAGADAKTFEIISWDWQRDKNFYYRFGKRIQYIDRNSFQLLDYNYAKDKSHVYYYGSIIEGADVKTFYLLEGTEDGKDSYNCYRQGEKVDCKVLQTEE